MAKWGHTKSRSFSIIRPGVLRGRNRRSSQKNPRLSPEHCYIITTLKQLVDSGLFISDRQNCIRTGYGVNGVNG
ncbi:hypothetical protein PISMIDRAFT_678520 [Pisolithus microcarpus 441]|uniref:Uncharacterized protein n=1 Tax=Pisolithus microcarpus 441 TaxID=765257 RepID=A0A0C9ZWN1_9AGAM|nr:hypothetical protein PISMIDRAFT_678520 [Pisolithus microcarpus 441]